MEQENLSSGCQEKTSSCGRSKRESIEAWHGDGTPRIIVEGPVMGLEKRGCIIWPYPSGEKLGAISGGTKGQKAKHEETRTVSCVLDNKSRMMREYHVRIYERLGVKSPGSTRQFYRKTGQLTL